MAVLQIVGLAGGVAKTPLAGQYLVEYDPDRPGVDPKGRPMIAHIVTTKRIDKALNLPRSELIALWRRQSTTTPLRPDGQPNRPLTAFTVQVINHTHEENA